MKRVVISQPMLFPWVGLFEQMQNADVWVHYDDVPLSTSSFTRRVQVKTDRGREWMTVPLAGFHLGQQIREVRPKPPKTWVPRHLTLLDQAYGDAQFGIDAQTLAKNAFSGPAGSLADLAINTMEVIQKYFGLAPRVDFVRSSSLGVNGSGSDRVLAIVSRLGGDTYVTGHGAKNYLEHEAFESAGIRVEYMDYRMVPYPQLHGEFTPFVSALDLVANVGKRGISYVCSGTVGWRTFLERHKTGAAT